MMATLGEFLKSVQPYAKDAKQIYDEIHNGPGSASLDEATRSSMKADEFQSELMGRITSLKSKIQGGWQGQSADSATNAAEPLRQHAQFNGQQLQQASSSIANQSAQFNSTKGQVGELPVNPDDESFFQNAKDFFTGDLVAKTAKYAGQVNANTQAYDRYYQATGNNAGALPSEYPPLDKSTSDLSISTKSSNGDSGGLGNTSSGSGSGAGAGSSSGAGTGSPSGAGSASAPSVGSSSGSASGNIGSGSPGADFKPYSPTGGTHSSGYAPAAARGGHDADFKPYRPSDLPSGSSPKADDFKPYSPHSLPSGSYSGDLPSGSTSSAGYDPGLPAPGGLGTGGFSGASYGGANSPSGGGAGPDAGMMPPPMMGGVGTGAGAGEGVRSGGGFGSRGPGAFGPQNPGGGAGAAEAAAKGAAGSGAAGGRGGPGMMGGAGGAGKGKKDDEEHSDEYYVDQDFDDGLSTKNEFGEKIIDPNTGMVVPPPVIGE